LKLQRRRAGHGDGNPGRAAPPEPQGRWLKGPAFGKPVPEAEGPAPWRTLRADLRRSGRIDAEVALPLRRLWRVSLGGQLAPLAAAGGLVWVGGDDRQVVALDTTTGQVRWRHFVAGRLRRPPFFWKGRLYASDDEGWAYCLRADNGELVWRFRVAPARGTLPIVTADTIYLRDGHSLTAEDRSFFRRAQGRMVHKDRPARGAPAKWLRWRACWDQRVTAVIKVGSTIFTGCREKVRATDAATGRALWSAGLKGTVGDLAFSAGRLLVTTDRGEVTCFAPGQ